jgi:hypothetical protein
VVQLQQLLQLQLVATALHPRTLKQLQQLPLLSRLDLSQCTNLTNSVVPHPRRCCCSWHNYCGVAFASYTPPLTNPATLFFMHLCWPLLTHCPTAATWSAAAKSRHGATGAVQPQSLLLLQLNTIMRAKQVLHAVTLSHLT